MKFSWNLWTKSERFRFVLYLEFVIELLGILLAYNARSIFDSSMPRVELLGIPLTYNARSTFDSSMPRVELLGIPLV